VSEPANISAMHARLEELNRELKRLHYQRDIRMSAFFFEEAYELGQAIAKLEREHDDLTARLPAEPVRPESTTPVLLRGRRAPRRPIRRS
jgi:hypothetical protein